MSDAAPCTNTLVNNQHVITKVYFPRLVLPLAAGCSPLIDFCIGLTVMIVLTLWLGIRPAPTVLLLPVLFFFAVFTALAGGAMDVGTERVVSRLHVHCSVHRAVLDVRVAGGVPEFARPGTVALAVRAEPHGWGDRRVSVGGDQARAASRAAAPGVGGRSGIGATWRAILL
jgi:hypothetical protein